MNGSASTAWFDAALSRTPGEHDVVVEGAKIHYLRWGVPSDPAVVLVHGGLAHARWWEHIAPLLTGYQVVALDLSGHGDSAHRRIHDIRQWGREIKAVADDAGLSRPVLVGHSMGGTPAVSAAVDFPDAIRGVITVDTRFIDQQWPVRDMKSATYPSISDALADFRPAHPVDGVEMVPFVLRRVAEASLCKEGHSWRWKRIERLEVVWTPLRKLLPRLHVPLALVRTQFGVLTQEAAEEMKHLTPARSMVAFLPGAAHNPMLEQPLALVEVLKDVLRDVLGES